jgi:hypothetical protein
MSHLVLMFLVLQSTFRNPAEIENRSQAANLQIYLEPQASGGKELAGVQIPIPEQNLSSSSENIKNSSSKHQNSPTKSTQRTLYDTLFSPRHMLNTLLGVAVGTNPSNNNNNNNPNLTAGRLRTSLSSQSTDSESEPDFYFYSPKHNEMYHHPPHATSSHPVGHSLRSSSNAIITNPPPASTATSANINNNNNNNSTSILVSNHNQIPPTEPDSSSRDQELFLAPVSPTSSQSTPTPRHSPTKLPTLYLGTDETLGDAGSSQEGSPVAPEFSQEISEDAEEDSEAIEAEEFNP